MSKTYSKTRVLVECALMIALSTVLSIIQLPIMPHGGSITIASMLPIILVSYRHGLTWGLSAAFINSLIQFVQGINNLAYCQTLIAQIGCVLLDYVLAFTVLGLASFFAKPFKNKMVGIGASSLIVCLLRYACSVLSGYIVWKDYDYAFNWLTEFGWGAAISNMGENALCWLYSFVYNAVYLLPEPLLTVIAAMLLAKLVPQLFERQSAQ